MKALLLRRNGEFPKTHSVAVLLQLAQKLEVVPDGIRDATELTDYAVQVRYPGDYYPVEKDEYDRAVEIAGRVVEWVAELLEAE